MPFLTIYYSQYLGFSDVQVGILSAITPVTTFFLNPQWCSFADKYHIHKRLLVICAICSSLVTLGLYFVPGYHTSETWLSDRFLITMFIVAIFSAFNAPIGAILDTIVIAKLRILMEKRLTESKDPRDAYGRCRFVGSLAYGIGAFIMSSLMDNTSKNKQTMLPMFYGWAICIGFLFPICLIFPERNPIKNGTNGKLGGGNGGLSKPSHIRSALGIMLDGPLGAAAGSSQSIVRVAPLELPSENDEDIILKVAQKQNQPVTVIENSDQECFEIHNTVNGIKGSEIVEIAQQPSILTLAKEIIDHPSGVGSTYMFWLFIFVKGCAFSVINNYLFLMMVQKLHASSMLLGYVSIARILFEMPFFYWSGKLSLRLIQIMFPSINDRIQKKKTAISGETHDSALILGMRWSMVVTMIVMTCRLAAIAIVGVMKISPWILLGVESFHGIIFAIFYSSAVQIAAKQAPSHLQGLSQGIFNAIYGGFGPFIGSLLGGLIYSVDSNALFAIMAICTSFCSLLYSWDIKRTNNSRPSTGDHQKPIITSVVLVE